MFTKFGEEMSIGQTTNHAKFCGGPTTSVRDTRDRKFVLPIKVSHYLSDRQRSQLVVNMLIISHCIGNVAKEFKLWWNFSKRSNNQNYILPSLYTS